MLRAHECLGGPVVSANQTHSFMIWVGPCITIYSLLQEIGWYVEIQMELNSWMVLLNTVQQGLYLGSMYNLDFFMICW